MLNALTRKYLMAITGLFLCSFLVVHLTGNLTLYASDGGISFNEYTLNMSSNPFIKIMEILLVAAFLIHIIDAVIISSRNRRARGRQYEVTNASENSSWFSRNMGITGTVILIFLIIHLRGFWYEYHYGAPATDANGNRDMYSIVVAAYSQWWYSSIYVVAMMLLGGHLIHGFHTGFQSLGLTNKKYYPVIRNIGLWFALIMMIGFASFPILFYFEIVGRQY